MSTAEIQARWEKVFMKTYPIPSVALTSGEGAIVTDADGKRYLDLYAGIAVNLLGHRHPAIIDAVTQQLSTLGHVSNFIANEPSIELAERLIAHVGAPARIFLCNSGTEANEVAFKITRLTGRTNIIATEPSFHGRTMGSLAITGQPAKRAPFEPMPPGVEFVPYGDVEALAAAVDADTAAVFLEPILGESGVIVPPPGYLAAARELTTKVGALLVLDEVQTGIGRTGTFYAHQADGIVPDVMTLAKGLGGGLPIGACLAIGDAAELLSVGMHGSTFGGNPVCSAAAVAVLRAVEELDLVERAATVGKTLAAGIEDLNHPLIDHVRGRGLLLGIVLGEPVSAAFEAAARQHGFLVNAPAPDVIRLAPPLVLTDEQAQTFIAALPAILAGAN